MRSFKAILCALVVLMVIGFGCWIAQQVYGLGITGMSNGTSWGLYICLFLLFVGLSAGGLIVAAAGSVFHVEDYEKVAFPASLQQVRLFWSILAGHTAYGACSPGRTSCRRWCGT